MTAIESLVLQLRMRSRQWHQEYGNNQYLVLKADMLSAQTMMRLAADELERMERALDTVAMEGMD